MTEKIGCVQHDCVECVAREQRKWIGLTNAEMEATCAETWSYDPHVIARAIEAKLKEKNI